ncbi:hypothetical protein C8R44DRAFT_753876 [Mycena epipterygia]|nr:hypothetical protein C8R44DRAFT_753876 [Mycena epipterygia]
MPEPEGGTDVHAASSVSAQPINLTPAHAPLRVKIVSIALRSAGRGSLREDESQHIATGVEGVHEARDGGRRTSNARAEKTKRVATPVCLSAAHTRGPGENPGRGGPRSFALLAVRVRDDEDGQRGFV